VKLGLADAVEVVDPMADTEPDADMVIDPLGEGVPEAVEEKDSVPLDEILEVEVGVRQAEGEGLPLSDPVALGVHEGDGDSEGRIEAAAVPVGWGLP
jgi:hypothetical protein